MHVLGVAMMTTYEFQLPKHPINLEHELRRLRFATDANCVYPSVHVEHT